MPAIVRLINKTVILGLVCLSVLHISGCKTYKEYMGYDRYEWDDSVSYIEEPHKLTCKQRSTKEAPRLCDGTLVNKGADSGSIIIGQ